VELRRQLRFYRKDPSIQAETTVKITPESVSIQNTAGVFWKYGWNVCDLWREENNLVIFVFRSGTFCISNLTGLSDMQRDELRGILSMALPKM
jgi:hypothetical protein